MNSSEQRVASSEHAQKHDDRMFGVVLLFVVVGYVLLFGAIALFGLGLI